MLYFQNIYNKIWQTYWLLFVKKVKYLIGGDPAESDTRKKRHFLKIFH